MIKRIAAQKILNNLSNNYIRKFFYKYAVPSKMLRSYERKLQQQILLHVPIKTIFYKKQ